MEKLMKTIDSIIAVPLLIGFLYLIFFAYRRIRINLFRDRVFKIRRSLFLIASDNSEIFFKDNSSYRFFESILNTSLSYAENFSLISFVFDVVIRFDYAKKKNIRLFDFEAVKNEYLEKIATPKTKEEMSKLLYDFQFHLGLFLMTRTFFGTCLFILILIVVVIVILIKMIYEEGREDLNKVMLNYSNKIMSNSQFAFTASMF